MGMSSLNQDCFCRKLRFSAELLYNLIPDMTVNIDQITSNKGCPLTNFILKYITKLHKVDHELIPLHDPFLGSQP